MRKFRVMIHGKNLLLNTGEVSKHGVLILRFVEAIDELLAAHTALEDFRVEPKGRSLMESLLNPSDDPPIFVAEEVIEVVSFDDCDNVNSGLMFYPEDEGNA